MKFHIVIIMLFRLIVSTKSSFPVESKQMMRTLLKCKKIFYNTFHNMFHIALNTFREIIRSRYFSLIFLFGIILFAGIFFFNELSLGQAEFIVPDFGLSFIEIVGLFLILFLGNRLLSKEFEEKTIYLTLSRPIARGNIILGKFLGFSAILAIAVWVLSGVLLILMLIFKLAITPIIFLSILGIFLKLLILLAVTLFLSIFLSGGIATFVTLAVYIVGHSGYMLLEYAGQTGNNMFHVLASAILFFFPNFLALNFKDQIHLGLPINMPHIAMVILFAVLYGLIVLGISRFVFSRKSFDSI